MKTLKKNSLFFDNFVQDFRNQFENYHILSFVEQRSIKKLIVVRIVLGRKYVKYFKINQRRL